MSKDKICAVVVTYNRKKLLMECIDSLRKQTRKLDCILVVNNDSTDGTKEWLDEQNDLEVIHQENLGGAGGFHNGMKWAYEKGFDWVWCMDDDCYAEENSLSLLLKENGNKKQILNSMVISKKYKNTLSFGLYDELNNRFYSQTDQLPPSNKIHGGNFFNGTLISSYTIALVGYPSKVFFIRGDEVDYYLRIIRNNKINIYTIIQSKVYHPEEITYKIKYLNYKYYYIDSYKRYFYTRNYVAIYKIYKHVSLVQFYKKLFLDLVIIILKVDFKSMYSFFNGLKDYKVVLKGYNE